MEQGSILDDRRIKVLNFLLQKHKIPEYGTFNLQELIAAIPPSEYKELFEEHPEFEQIWQSVDMAKSLTAFLIENGLAKKEGDNLQLTMAAAAT